MQNKLSPTLEILKDLILKKDKALLNELPIERYIEMVESYPPVSGYHYRSDQILNLCKKIVSRTNRETLELYHKLVLVELINRANVKLERMILSAEIVNFYHINFDRVLKDIFNNSYRGFYGYDKDKFRKDIALCSLRLIPAGAQKIHLNGMPRRFLVQGGLLQFMRCSFFIATQLQGNAPLYEMHTDSNDPHLMQQFNPEGWMKFYGRVAELLLTNRGIKGIFGSSWFFDPVLDQISPRLSYLRRFPVDNGAQLFRLGPSEQSVHDATTKSQTRRTLYQEGKYFPTSYMLVWARQKLIDCLKS